VLENAAAADLTVVLLTAASLLSGVAVPTGSAHDIMQNRLRIAAFRSTNTASASADPDAPDPAAAAPDGDAVVLLVLPRGKATGRRARV
jgi:hypothetical protein